MNKREVILKVGQQISKGLPCEHKGWTFTFDFATGYRAVRLGGDSYSYFDDLAGMVDHMFKDGCFDE